MLIILNNNVVYLTATLYCLKKIYVNRYSFMVRRSYPKNKYLNILLNINILNVFLFKVSNSDLKMMFRRKNKDIRKMFTLSVFLVDSEQVNVCQDVIKSLLNGVWPISKMLYNKLCSHPSNFYWHNALMYSFFKKMQVTRFRITYQKNLITSETKLCS